MKTIKFCTLTFAFALIAFAAQAQRAGSEEAAIKNLWNSIYQAFETGNNEAMWAAYTDNAGEIGPDGSLTIGKEKLKASWEAFMKMVDEAPKFTLEEPTVRILTPDVAILTWQSSADIKVGGQQFGGKSVGMAVVRKIKGNWMVEFDSMTPVMEMPGTGN
ncbi:MAG TPA: SgcJ/EcaC family oxidoreductase [Flavilitoribacter sp.]|nr:SgcJ/EcaC family oxidoreductase [Flavilitoribacter sp.]HMQ89366.1 SgcJ/EcaC family oxidoreductase [Flavilitoribacter sp.]